jgi:hypothetical protein
MRYVAVPLGSSPDTIIYVPCQCCECRLQYLQAFLRLPCATLAESGKAEEDSSSLPLLTRPLLGSEFRCVVFPSGIRLETAERSRDLNPACFNFYYYLSSGHKTHCNCMISLEKLSACDANARIARLAINTTPRGPHHDARMLLARCTRCLFSLARTHGIQRAVCRLAAPCGNQW